MKIMLLLLVAVVFLAGCASLLRTVEVIREDPATFQAEAKEITESLPLAIPAAVGIAVGYAWAFGRRVYANHKRKEAKTISG